MPQNLFTRIFPTWRLIFKCFLDSFVLAAFLRHRYKPLLNAMKGVEGSIARVMPELGSSVFLTVCFRTLRNRFLHPFTKHTRDISLSLHFPHIVLNSAIRKILKNFLRKKKLWIEGRKCNVIWRVVGEGGGDDGYYDCLVVGWRFVWIVSERLFVS